MLDTIPSKKKQSFKNLFKHNNIIYFLPLCSYMHSSHGSSSSGTSINRTCNRLNIRPLPRTHYTGDLLDQSQFKNNTTNNDSRNHYSLLRCLMQSSTWCLNTWRCCPNNYCCRNLQGQPQTPATRLLHHRAARKKRHLLLRVYRYILCLFMSRGRKYIREQREK